jgi:NTP pyrophosphatase (non-canonical NTP hydrolase)
MSDIFQYAKGIYENSASKGFWEEGLLRNKGKMVMLMISELSECMEGDRNNNWFRLKPTTDWSILSDEFGKGQIDWIEHFEKTCKNTIEDEIADVVIRVLDYMWGWKIPYVKAEYVKKTTGDFAEDLLNINWYILLAYHKPVPAKHWSYVIAAIQKFCEWHDIDLEQHVQWKMRYNSSRPHKHGKKY